MAVDDRDLQRLRNRLDESYAQLKQRQRSDSDRLKSWEKEFKTLREGLIDSTKTMQDDMVERFRELEEDMRRKYVLQINEMKEEYNREVEHIHKIEKQYNAIIDELDSEQKRIIADYDKKNIRAREIAKCQEQEFDSTKNVALQLPVDVFYPHRLEQYLKAGERARHLMEEGLYNLSANDYSNICLGINGLIEDTNQRIRELDAMFEIYRTLVSSISLMKTSPWELTDDDGDVVLSLDDERDMDYWSDSLFYQLSVSLEIHRRTAEAGSELWIQQHMGSSISPALLLDKEIKGLEMIPKQLEVCTSYALSACDCYNYLYEVKDIASKILMEQNYSYIQTLFGEKKQNIPDSPGYEYYTQWLSNEECIKLGSSPDYREERCIRFSNPEGNLCFLYMVPVREKATVKTFLYIESYAEHNPEKVRYVLQTILSSALGRNVNICSNINQVSTASDRVMSEEELRRLAAVQDKSHLEAKYCSGV